MKRFLRILPLLFLVCACARAEEKKPPLPESPKDDEHWHPELPGENVAPHEGVPNGGFEEARTDLPRGPAGWSHPDGLTIFWVRDESEHKMVMMIDTSVPEGEAKKRQAQLREALAAKSALPPAPAKTSCGQYGTIGANNGVSIYSEKIKCKPKQAYKISFDYKGPSAAKVWVRGWGPLGGEERRRWETYVACRVSGGGWHHFEQAFHPTRRLLSKDNVKYIEISYLRVMLYAYWPNGTYYFDNVKIEEISDEEYERMKAIPADVR
jgi:hypothetical protein